MALQTENPNRVDRAARALRRDEVIREASNGYPLLSRMCVLCQNDSCYRSRKGINVTILGSVVYQSLTQSRHRSRANFPNLTPEEFANGSMCRIVGYGERAHRILRDD